MLFNTKTSGLASDEGTQIRHRDFQGPLRTMITALSILLPLYGMVYVVGIFDWLGIYVYEQQHMAIILGMALVLIFCIKPAHPQAPLDKLPWYDIVLSILAVIGTGYLIIYTETVLSHWGVATPLEQVLGVITIALILEAVRREIGWPMVGLAGFFMVYVLWGDIFPGVFQSKNYPLYRVIGNYYLASMGIFGLPLKLAATVILAFVIFANFMNRTGAGKFIIELVYSQVGHMRGGAAKTAVLGSSLFGTLSGSSVANATTTGSVTIPLMKKSGYTAEAAGAVEAAASTGGLLVPPVMGPNAFLMAEFLGISYLAVIKAAFIPAVLYYICLFFQTHFEALKGGHGGLSKEALPRLKATLLQDRGWQFIIPLVVLVYFLVIKGYPPEVSVLYAVAALLILRILNKGSRSSLLQNIMPALADSGRGLLSIIVVCATAGLLVGSITQTGLIYTLGTKVLALAGGSLLLLLILSAVASIVLGMGLDALAVYIIVATIVVPSLIKAGVMPIAAHFFVLYFGIMSFLTPPVAITAFATAAIAQARFMATAVQATRFAIVAFLVPFMFIYDPVLLSQGAPFFAILYSFVTALLGVIYLAGAMAGYFIRSLNWVERLIIAGAGVLSMIPGWQSDLAGMLVIIVVTIYLMISAKAGVGNQLKVS